jgi:hypothetical protein
VPRRITSACLLAGLVALASACHGNYAPLRIEAGPNLTPGDRNAITHVYFAETMTEIYELTLRPKTTPILLPKKIDYYVFNPTGSFRIVLTAYGDATPDPVAVGIAEFDMIDGNVVSGADTDGRVVLVLDPLVQ